MKITLQWLRRYVDFNGTPEDLAERLTMLGLEVEGVQRTGAEFDGVVVAQVITRDPHPNADKLSVCRVNDGQGERIIVCGAHNFQAGDKVPLILPGHALPARRGEPPYTIKVGKIRGIESHGMMCSPSELGLSGDAEGLLILPPTAPVGQPFAEFLGRSGQDVVFDLEVTPNRPDLNSVIGIAREISAATGQPLRLPETTLAEDPDSRAADGVAVRIEDPDLCPRYTARLIRGVKIGPSPDWLRRLLELVGLRSISNVVDVTNFVMLETGQPLHAFDYRLISRAAGEAGQEGLPTIVVRRARPGEKIATLDGQERSLTTDMLLIADEQRAIALAGVMGGLNSEINDRTADVLLESAYFKPTSIRRTSKLLDLRSDASYRYERGADIGIADWASRRAAQLILETAGGRLASGVVDAYPRPAAPRHVSVRFARTDALLGIPIPAAEQVGHLRRLGLEPMAAGGSETTPEAAGIATVQIPSFRVDLKEEVDLIEEIGRLHGVDRIPATPPRGALGAHPHDAVHDDLAAARRLLCGLGLSETQGQTLISDALAARVLPPEEAGSIVRLGNPLSSDMNVLRPSLTAGLLDALRRNINRQESDLALFEIGRVFRLREAAPADERHLGLALTGRRHQPFWSGADRSQTLDLYDLKGILEEFLDLFGVRGYSYARRAGAHPLFLESAQIVQGKQVLGEIGQLLPAAARQLDLRDAVLVAELSMDLLLARRNASKQFRPLPAFPSVRRDVAMVAPESLTHEAALGAIRKARPTHLEAVELFDVFRGGQVPAGHKSMAYALTYRHPERTLTDAEVNAIHEKLVASLKQDLPVQVREG
ncbi:MAG TPA: phenylalanine--tRNA ligase subunit beta [Candidatus Paceibacterota bacterium]|nr:phenylalanine--tRNA ligase subunit beta [Verrucomicrobiota bacterium]HOX02481.1 phenylalanine--tRNA ligase subunit beta [Verrucomicrobiota bacterium]HRZ44915.1 phenylalanine--tRNA ligase subunit beta [Candidatus Paceibacterota bacterium]HRZ92350.1 phenylalanine--tRNA ligase subunit beta [Candidatus Paceibacterota bacterium]